MQCLNCNTVFDSNFCPFCGQSGQVRRITGKEVYKGILQSVGNLDRGFLHTLFSLVSNPVALARDYLDGKRVSHQKPLTFFLIITTLQVVLNKIIMALDNSFSVQDGGGIAEGPVWLAQMIGNSPAIIALVIFPFIALGFYMGYRKHGNNFGEHFYISIFLFSLIQVGFLIANLLILAFPGLQTYLGLIYIPIIYWFYFAYYRGKTRNVLTSLLRTTASILLSLVLMIVFASAMFVLVVQVGRLIS
jgi:hypothetical protein